MVMAQAVLRQSDRRWSLAITLRTFSYGVCGVIWSTVNQENSIRRGRLRPVQNDLAALS